PLVVQGDVRTVHGVPVAGLVKFRLHLGVDHRLLVTQLRLKVFYRFRLRLLRAGDGLFIGDHIRCGVVEVCPYFSQPLCGRLRRISERR
ncbi:hypothetical protein SAMN05421680_1321, partial [Xenorhabdus mauleonii]